MEIREACLAILSVNPLAASSSMAATAYWGRGFTIITCIALKPRA
jgi:hypothetical protein